MKMSLSHGSTLMTADNFKWEVLIEYSLNNHCVFLPKLIKPFS